MATVTLVSSSTTTNTTTTTKNIPAKMLAVLFGNVTSFLKSTTNGKRILFKVKRGTTKDQQREIVAVVKQYYPSWYIGYGGIGGTEFHVDFYAACRDNAFNDLAAQQKKYFESDEYASSSSADTSPITTADTGTVIDDEPDETETTTASSANGNQRTIIIVAAVAVAAIIGIMLMKK